VAINPLSVNDAYTGRRFTSRDYKAYKKELFLRLPAKYEVPNGGLKICLEFGMSNAGADADNPIKPLVDILQKKYGFNDNRVYRYEVDKVIVKKGFEYVKFKITTLEGLALPNP